MNLQSAQNRLTSIGDEIAEALRVNISKARVVSDLYRRPDLSEIQPNYIDVRTSDMQNSNGNASPFITRNHVDNNFNFPVDNCAPDCHDTNIHWLQIYEVHYWAVNCETCANPIQQVLAMGMDGIKRLYSSDDLKLVKLELVRQDAPEREDGQDMPAAKLVQHWQTYWNHDPIRPERK